MIDVELLRESLPRLLGGLIVTLQLLLAALAAGGALALPLALARLSRRWTLRWPIQGYIFFFRGTPLLVQIFLVYFGSGQFRDFFEMIGLWPVLREAYWCAVIALALNTAAYTAEILRGGILAVPAGEIEAARALGLSRPRILRHIVLPRSLRLALPAYGNEAILMLKASALASAVALPDLMGVSRAIFSRTFQFEIYLYAGAIYLALSFLIGRAVLFLEAWLSPELRAPNENRRSAT